MSADTEFDSNNRLSTHSIFLFTFMIMGVLMSTLNLDRTIIHLPAPNNLSKAGILAFRIEGSHSILRQLSCVV